jgi:hypothetical protein
MSKTKILICPYCGETQAAGERCRGCGGLFEPLSRQATHNAMGPWFVRDPGKPFHPGCSYETLVRMIDRGQITRTSIIRGPTTKQFWTVARRVPGVAHLLGYCHSCDARVDPGDHGCHACGVTFGAYLDRNYLGLPEVRPLPWEADAREGGPGSVDDDLAARQVLTGGLSQFASDDELLDHGDASEAPRSAPARTWTPPRPRPEGPALDPAAGAASGGGQPTVFDESSSAMVTRALRRKLASQQRTVRVMAVVAVLALVAAIIANLDTLAGMVGLDGTSAPPTAASGGSAAPARDAGGQTAKDELDAAVLRDQAHQSATPPAAASESTVAPPAAPATEEPSADAGQAVEPTPAAGTQDAYSKALELIAAAGQDDRSPADRIADYRRALKSLETIGGSVPTDLQPADLAGQIERIRREIERLQLKEFFG